MTDEHPASSEQLALLRDAARSGHQPTTGTSQHEGAHERVAVVRPLLPVPHLDRDFEYLIPRDMDDEVSVGVAVKVRFSGQDATGYVLGIRGEAEHEGALKPIRRVVSPLPVLTPSILRISEQVAAWCGGSVSDVLRLAIPPRHARAEAALDERQPPKRGPRPFVMDDDSAWLRYAGGQALLRHIAAGEGPGASWIAAAGQHLEHDWPAAIAELVGATRASGRGSLIIVPDSRDVDRIIDALTQRHGDDGIVRLTADQGPQARYTSFVKIVRGFADVVVGTRSAMFAPVHRLGLAMWWDDADLLHAEPRAPYPHVRDVLRYRAADTGAALVSGGPTRTAAIAAWVAKGLLAKVEPVERTSARVVVTGDDRSIERHGPAAQARMPADAWRGAREALNHGPVLVQVPRRGYLPALACQNCREKARCEQCQGPLGFLDPDGPPTCRWCGHVAHVFTCRECGGHTLRALVIGAGRTAEELGRAFPGVPVRRSGAPDVMATVDAKPALVVSTPGAEPVADGGYAAAVLLDAWALLDRTGLNAGENALTNWTRAVDLVRPAADGGAVYLCGVPRHVTFRPVEALVRSAPGWFADRELAERAELNLPPVSRMAAIEGPRRAGEDFAHELEQQARRGGVAIDVLGPLPLGQRHAFDRSAYERGRGADGDDEPAVRYLARWPDATDVAPPALVRDVKSERSAARAPAVTVRCDPPLDLGAGG